MLAPPLAHLGHWYVSGPLYLAPILAVVAWVKLSQWMERRRERGDADGDER